MKKITKMTALLLAAAIALTPCENGSGILLTTISASAQQRGAKATSSTSYSTAKVTKVKNKTYTMFGKKGSYTGDWKNDRPEGNGEWKIDEYEYCKGNWKNGMLEGDAIYAIFFDDGTYHYYDGVCSQNKPSGYGFMSYSLADDSYCIVWGDFKTKKQLKYEYYDSDDRPADVGLIIDGKVQSFITSKALVSKGKTYIPDNIGVDTFVHMGMELTTHWKGTYRVPDNSVKQDYYYGKIYCNMYDEKGRPDGIGYFDAQYKYYGKNNGTNKPVGVEYNKENKKKYGDNLSGKTFYELSELDSSNFYGHLRYIGEWEEGVRVGKYIAYYTREKDPDWYVVETGETDENGNEIGEWTREAVNCKLDIAATGHKTAKYMIYKMNRTTYNQYKKSSDGLYRGSYDTMDVYYEDGQYAHFESCLYKKKYSDTTSYREGTWYLFDKSGNVIDWGDYVGSDHQGKWRNQAMIKQDNKASSKKINWGAVAAIGAMVGGAYLLYKGLKNSGSSVSGSSIDSRLALHRQQLSDSLARERKKDELLEEADKYDRLGDHYKAKELRKQAENLPIVTVMTTTDVLIG